jgi:hypothetical protein
MAPKYEEKGGGPSVGLANDFVSGLQSLLFGGGGMGAPIAGARAGAADPMGQTTGMMGILSSLLSPGAGEMGGAMSEMISKQNERDVAGLRARYGASGGMGFGTPAAYAESLYRAEAAPRATMAVGNLQLQALQQLLPIFTSLAGKGITQREGVMSPNPLASGIAIAAPIIGGIAGGPAGAAIASGIGNMFAGGGARPAAASPAVNNGVGVGMQHWNQTWGTQSLMPGSSIGPLDPMAFMPPNWMN